MTGIAVEFEIHGVCYRPACEHCNATISAGFAYIHNHRDQNIPVIDFYCSTCVPDWMRKAAIANRGSLSPLGKGEMSQRDRGVSP
jgi:hypothetical protein